MVKNIILLAAAFVIGSIPFGIITAKAKGIDLKKVGSGNIGATNVLRSLGKWPAIVTLLGDILKGTLAVAIGKYSAIEPLYVGLIGMSAILGHNYSIFLGFRGGKGVATSIGVLLLYIPYGAVITLFVWILVVLVTKYSSLGAIVSFTLLPLSVFVIDPQDKTKFFISMLISVFIIVRHQENIKRLIKGTEPRIGQRA
jgi:acyl phosphate:glycerol-3-phosphate acyltransferase